LDHFLWTQMYVEEVAELVELIPLRGALVGLPGVNGLSTEQRKRLTIAVELVANPSIIFMDEPTSGLDATAAAIVMRAVRNTVDTGRTVVCTIHQPSIDIFEAFDEVSSINDEKIVEVILEPVLSLRLQAVLELL
jgi:ABC-type multidrug transport system ATPase subunit